MSIQQTASRTIGKTRGIEYTLTNNGTTGDIIQLVLTWFNKYNADVKSFAPALRGSSLTGTCYNIWAFVRNNITYKKDPEGYQWIKSPGKLWADRKGDCKSYSVFIGSCLAQLGIDFIFRFVSYDPASSIPTHVYVVVPYQGSEIIIDACLNKFNYQLPYQHKIDYPMTRVIGLAGPGLPPQRRLPPRTHPGVPVRRPVYKPVATLGGFDYFVGYIDVNSGAAAAANAAAGNWAGAITSALNFLKGLFAGHSNWYKSDQSLANKDYNAVAQSYIAFYTQPGYNSNGQAGFQGDLQGGMDGNVLPQYKGQHVKRYTQLPLVFKKTQNPYIYRIYSDAVNAGLIQADPTIVPPVGYTTTGSGSTGTGTGTGTGTASTTGYTLSTGATLFVTSLNPGGYAYTNGFIASPGSYKLTQGYIVTVGANGLITAVTTGSGANTASMGILPILLFGGVAAGFIFSGKKKKR